MGAVIISSCKAEWPETECAFCLMERVTCLLLGMSDCMRVYCRTVYPWSFIPTSCANTCMYVPLSSISVRIQLSLLYSRWNKGVLGCVHISVCSSSSSS